MKFRVETWKGKKPVKWKLVHECDTLDEALVRARQDEAEQDAGKMVSRVLDVSTGKVMYARGFVLNAPKKKKSKGA